MESWLPEALAALRRGEAVACATETFQGLLADALQEEAVAGVARLKRRKGEPIALLVPDMPWAERVLEPLTGVGLELARRYWPGPVTLVDHARMGLCHWLQRDGKVGVRVPGPSPALELVRAFAGPLTATSANLSGQPSARSTEQVRGYFPAGLGFVVPLDAPGGEASAVVDVSVEPAHLIRPGGPLPDPAALDALHRELRGA